MMQQESVFCQPSLPLQGNGSFRLQNGPESIKNQSRYHMKCKFKQRIDSLFDETRSAILETNVSQSKYTRACQSECGASPIFQHCNNILPYKFCEEKFIKNAVQAQIEKMFADVNTSEIKAEESLSNIQQFQVDYIGSLPLFGKVTSLQGLQEPLKNLYFNYRRNKHSSSKLQALLEISPDGLKIQTFQNGPRTAIKEQLNPFPSIAVWAALKFICRPQYRRNGVLGLEYAFLPLIIDQKDSEKSSLFRSLDQNDVSCALEKTYDDHSPLFVVIMRQTGTASNRLQCHGFACATSEDAILLAANLYKTLAATLSNSSDISNNSFQGMKEIKCCNGLGTVCSIARCSVYEEQDCLYSQKRDLSLPTNKPEVGEKIPPPRPPRKNKIQSDKESAEVHHEIPTEIIIIKSDEITVMDDINAESIICSNNNVKSIGKGSINAPKSSDKTSYSIYSRQSTSSNKIESGDIFTKVVIPRSKSFLNASGPLNSRFNRCITNYMNEINSSNRKNSIHSPLGFIELFNELRIHEGLNNIDEILNMIIDVDGMSFNSLKPIYKEFIFKLAVTLTKDELYQRSKSIMQKQKHRKRQMMFNGRTRFVSGYRIKRVFHVSFSKLSSLKYKINLPFVSQLFPVFKKTQKSKHQFKPKMKLKRHNATSTLASNDSFILGFNKYNNNNSTCLPNDIYKDRFFYLKRGEISFHKKKLFSSDILQATTCSTENTKLLSNGSDKIANQCIHKVISNYVSCSESCKYRCYCSFNKHTKRERITRSQDNTMQQLSVSSCSCETDSCIESEKCYCNHSKKPSIFEQLKQQGFAASESSLSSPSSRITSWQRNEKIISDTNEKKTCLQTSKSLEFFHINKNVTQPPSNYEDSQLNVNKGYFQSDLENFSCLHNNAQNKKYPIKSLKTSLISCDDDDYNLNKFEVNSNVLNHSENSDNDDYSLNYWGKQFNYNSDSYVEDENNTDKNLINSEYFGLDSKNSAEYEHNKILVVSTRDEKGQVKNSVTPLYNLREIQTNNYMHENDAIGVKKAAEIAALFSDMKEKKNHFNISNKVINNLMSSSIEESIHTKKINLENSLGYFP